MASSQSHLRVVGISSFMVWGAHPGHHTNDLYLWGILTDRSTDFTGLTSKVLPSDVVAMSGVYVDGFLNVGS